MMRFPSLGVLILLASCGGSPSVMPVASSVASGAKTSALFNDPQGIAKSRDEGHQSSPDSPSNAPTVPADVLDRSDPAPRDAGVDAAP